MAIHVTVLIFGLAVMFIALKPNFRSGEAFAVYNSINYIIIMVQNLVMVLIMQQVNHE